MPLSNLIRDTTLAVAGVVVRDEAFFRSLLSPALSNAW